MKTVTVCLALTGLVAASRVAPAQEARPAPAAALPTASQSIDVAGTWLADQARMQSSSCPVGLTEVIDERIQSGNLNCTFGIVQADSLVHVFERCPDETMDFVASIDAAGKLRFSASTVVMLDDCYLLFTDTLSVELGRSPTTLTSKYLYQFHPSCGVRDCAVEITRRLRRIGLADRGPAPYAARCVAAPGIGVRRARHATSAARLTGPKNLRGPGWLPTSRR